MDYYSDLQNKAGEIALKLSGLAALHSHYKSEDENEREMEARIGVGRLLEGLSNEVREIEKALDSGTRPTSINSREILQRLSKNG